LELQAHADRFVMRLAQSANALPLICNNYEQPSRVDGRDDTEATDHQYRCEEVVRVSVADVLYYARCGAEEVFASSLYDEVIAGAPPVVLGS
jgi:hypothetical protein